MKKFICCFALLALFSALLSGCAGSREITLRFEYPSSIPLTEPVEMSIRSWDFYLVGGITEVENITVMPHTPEIKLEVEPDALDFVWFSREIGWGGNRSIYGFDDESFNTFVVSLSPIKVSHAEKLPEPFYYKLKSKPTIFKNIELSWVDQGLRIRPINGSTMRHHGLAMGSGAWFYKTPEGLPLAYIAAHLSDIHSLGGVKEAVYPFTNLPILISGQTSNGLYYAYQIMLTRNLMSSENTKPAPVEGGVSVFPILDNSEIPYRNEFIVQCPDQERAEEVYFSEYERNKKSNESYYKPVEPVK